MRHRDSDFGAQAARGGSTTSLRLSRSASGRAMAHDEEQEWHSAVKQKPVDSHKFTHIWVVAPRLEFVV